MKDRLFQLSSKVVDLAEKVASLKQAQPVRQVVKLDPQKVVNFLKFFAKER